jgi:hypothetical protein
MALAGVGIMKSLCNSLTEEVSDSIKSGAILVEKSGDSASCGLPCRVTAVTAKWH